MYRRTLTLLLLLLLGGCETPTVGESLLYVLQPSAVALSDLIAAEFSWLILEPTTDGSAGSDFSTAEIEQVRSGGTCTKRVLAYLSIGEAEDYRDYWSAAWVDADGNPILGVAPAWLGPTNPEWSGNYKVRYWEAAWQAVIFGTPSGSGKTPLDRIIDQKFDGVYLDIVDAYDFWSTSDGGSELSRMDARQRMIEFIEAIGYYARTTRGVTGFLVFPQNAAGIIRNDDGEFDALTDRYFLAIDGIGQEDLFYNELTAQPQAGVDSTLAHLNEFRSRSKTVLVTDYVIDQANPGPTANDGRANDLRTRCRALGFVPYAAHRDRDLNEIVAFRGAGWSSIQPEPGCPTAQN